MLVDRLSKKTPLILSVLKELVAPETAGDPMTAQKWVRSSLHTLSAKLEAAGHTVSPLTVGRLLRKLDYSLQVNAEHGSLVEPPSPGAAVRLHCGTTREIHCGWAADQ